MSELSRFKSSGKRLSAVGLAIALGIAPLSVPPVAAAQETTTSGATTTNAQAIDLMKKRWVEGIIGSSGQYDSDEAKALVSRINNKGNSLWETMVKSDVADREYLQVDEGGKWAADLSRYFRDGFDGLRFIAQAWATPGTDLYGREDVKKELIAGLDHMVDKGYDGEQMIGNWWPWQIGGAQRFTDILLLLDSQGALTQQQIEHYTGIINKYDPTPQKQLTRGPKQADGTETWGPLTFSDKESAGGNRLDIAVVVLGTGLLRNDTDRVAMAVKGIEPFMLNTDGNGFRDDGSYVDHESFAYTGGYGESLITALSRILSVTAGTDYAAGDEYATSFGHSLSYGVLPNIYRGIGIPALKGRGLTRKVASGPDAWCNSVVFRLIDLADSMPESDRKEILAASKYWIENSKECFNRKAGSFTDLNAIKKAVEQGETLTSRPAQGAYIYPQMDRFIDREENHVFSLGLYSDRISSYEVGAHENIRGWHFADGMTYLFNGDSMQFLGDYWPTVDPYRLPGTTVDTRALPDDDSSYRERPGKNMDATGGVATDNLSAISQYIDKSDWVLNDNTPNEKSADMDLQATKSWFVFPDRIIALGAGISGTTTGNKDADGADASIETVVDNRIIGDGLYSVTDGTGTDLGGGKNSLDTVIYQPSGDATPIAYRMLDGTQASFKRVDRTGAWNDINQREKHMETVSNTFGTVTIDHGAEAKDASYAYSIEPGATVESLAKEKDADPVKIVSNTADVQSIETTDGSKFAANVFAPDGAKLPQGFKATTRLSVVAEKTAADSYTLTISDPSQKQDYVTIVTPDSVLWATGEGVTYDAATHELKVPTANKKGSAVAVSLTVKPKEEEIPSDGEETTVPTDDGQKSPGTSASVTQSSDSGKTSSGGNLPVIAGGVFGALALLIGVLWTFLGQFPNLIHQMR